MTSPPDSNPDGGVLHKMCSNCFICLNVCLVLVYSGLRRICCPCRIPADIPLFDVLCLGVSGAGKSTLMRAASAPVDMANEVIAPTTGFHMHTVSLGTTATLQVKEIGGSDKIRPYWPQYFTDQNDAIVFVVDAYAASHSVDCDELAKLLTNTRLKGLSLLILANTSAKEPLQSEPVSRAELTVRLHLTSITDRKWYIHECSAHDRESILRGLSLILPEMQSRYATTNST